MEIEVREMVAADAEGVVACFERCYGSTYPNADLYDPIVIAARMDAGSLASVVAVTEDRRIVGHTGLTVRDPRAVAPEAGNTVVDPEARGQGLLGRMGAALAQLCRDRGSSGYVHYPTGAHEIMQRASVADGGVETGVMLAYVPADTDYVAVDQAAGRIATTVVYRPLGSAPEREVVLPERYRALLTGLYAEAGLVRQLLTPTTPAGSSEVSYTTNTRRDVTQIRVEVIGADLASVIADLIAADPAVVVHVDLPLRDGGADPAVESLRAIGFRYCGLLPEFGLGDMLRMQKLVGLPVEVERPRLVNESAQRMVELINSEEPGATADP